MYKVQNKHVVSNNVQKHKIFERDRMNTLQTHKCTKFKKMVATLDQCIWGR